PTTLAFALSPPARHSRVYRHPLRTGESISRLPRFAVATACRVACPLAVLTGRRPADGDFYSRAFGGSVTLPVVGYNYDGNWVISPAGLASAGTPASIVALAQ